MEQSKQNLALAVYALKRCGFTYGNHVFITGCDALSLALGVLAQSSGAASVVLGVRDDCEARRAEALGLIAYRYGQEEPAQMAERITGKRLFDLVFETRGEAMAYDVFLDILKRGGVAGLLAELPEPYTYYVKVSIRSQLRFIGIRHCDETSLGIAEELLETDVIGKLAATMRD